MGSKIATVRPMSWLLTIPQFLATVVLVGISIILWGKEDLPLAILIGLVIYLAYSFGSRWLLLRSHRKGMRLTRAGRMEEAIAQFEKSHAFFSRHSWIDRFRPIVMMSPAAFSFREMALINIAYCYVQLDKGQEAKAAYERVLRKFPESAMASSALKLIAAVENTRPAQ